MAASNTELDTCWTAVSSGIDGIMNSLDQGLSYARYMQLYTYENWTKIASLIYNYCTSSKLSTGFSTDASASNSAGELGFIIN